MLRKLKLRARRYHEDLEHSREDLRTAFEAERSHERVGPRLRKWLKHRSHHS